MYVSAADLERAHRAPVMLGAGKAGEVEAAPVLTYAATGAAAGMVAGPYGAAAGAVLGAAYGIWQGMSGPSKAWRRFASRLGTTLTTIQDSTKQLIEYTQDAKTPARVGQAIDLWYRRIGQHVGGFARGRPSGAAIVANPALAYQLPTPPGATGTAHEGGLVANFEPVMAQLRRGIELKIKSLTEPQPEAAAPKPVLAAGMFGGPTIWLFLVGGPVAYMIGQAITRRRR